MVEDDHTGEDNIVDEEAEAEFLKVSHSTVQNNRLLTPLCDFGILLFTTGVGTGIE